MTQITVSESTHPNYQGGGSTATLRIYSNQSFLTSDSVRIFKQRAPGPVWYKSIACTVAGSVLTIPQFVIDSTTDSDHPQGTYTAILFDADDNLIDDDFLKRFRVPITLGTPIIFAQLIAYNETDHPYIPGQTFTQDQVAAMIAAAVAGGGGSVFGTATLPGGQSSILVVHASALLTSRIFVTPQTDDLTAKTLTVTRGAGSFTITANMEAIADVEIAFLIMN